VDPSALIAASYPLANADEALNQAGVRGTLKVLIETGTKSDASGHSERSGT